MTQRTDLHHHQPNPMAALLAALETAGPTADVARTDAPATDPALFAAMMAQMSAVPAKPVQMLPDSLPTGTSALNETDELPALSEFMTALSQMEMRLASLPSDAPVLPARILVQGNITVEAPVSQAGPPTDVAQPATEATAETLAQALLQQQGQPMPLPKAETPPSQLPDAILSDDGQAPSPDQRLAAALDQLLPTSNADPLAKGLLEQPLTTIPVTGADPRTPILPDATVSDINAAPMPDQPQPEMAVLPLPAANADPLVQGQMPPPPMQPMALPVATPNAMPVAMPVTQAPRTELVTPTLRSGDDAPAPVVDAGSAPQAPAPRSDRPAFAENSPVVAAPQPRADGAMPSTPAQPVMTAPQEPVAAPVISQTVAPHRPAATAVELPPGPILTAAALATQNTAIPPAMPRDQMAAPTVAPLAAAPQPAPEQPTSLPPMSPLPAAPQPTSTQPNASQPASLQPTPIQPTSPQPASPRPAPEMTVAPATVAPVSVAPASVTPVSFSPVSVTPTTVAPVTPQVTAAPAWVPAQARPVAQASAAPASSAKAPSGHVSDTAAPAPDSAAAPVAQPTVAAGTTANPAIAPPPAFLPPEAPRHSALDHRSADRSAPATEGLTPRVAEPVLETRVETPTNAPVNATTANSDAFAQALTEAGAPSPDAMTEPDQPPPPAPVAMDQPDWESKVVDMVTAQMTADGAVIEITLSPENLGNVEVRVELRDGAAEVRFVTETREAAQAFTASESRLAELLQRNGLSLSGQDSSQRQRQDSAQGNGTGTGGRRSAEPDSTPESTRQTGRVNLIA